MGVPVEQGLAPAAEREEVGYPAIPKKNKEADTLGHNQNQKLNFDLDIVVLTTVSTTIFFCLLLLKEEKLRFSSLNLNFWFLFPFSPLHVRKYASRG